MSRETGGCKVPFCSFIQGGQLFDADELHAEPHWPDKDALGVRPSYQLWLHLAINFPRLYKASRFKLAILR